MRRKCIPIKIRRAVEQKFGLKCGFPGCRKPAENLHHARRFALTKRHLAGEIVPLCKSHHELAHAGVIEGEGMEAQLWRLDLRAKRPEAKERIDRLVQKKRREAKK